MIDTTLDRTTNGSLEKRKRT